MNIDDPIARLTYLLAEVPAKLSAISEQALALKPSEDKWSKKEVIGHLIDSAANNHQRFIRIQYESTPTIFYNQNKWNELNHYQRLESKHIIDLWTIYNKHLLEVIKSIPAESLLREGNSGGENNLTLVFLINDYVEHMEHHLKQIISY